MGWGPRGRGKERGREDREGGEMGQRWGFGPAEEGEEKGEGGPTLVVGGCMVAEGGGCPKTDRFKPFSS